MHLQHARLPRQWLEVEEKKGRKPLTFASSPSTGGKKGNGNGVGQLIPCHPPRQSKRRGGRWRSLTYSLAYNSKPFPWPVNNHKREKKEGEENKAATSSFTYHVMTE